MLEAFLRHGIIKNSTLRFFDIYLIYYDKSFNKSSEDYTVSFIGGFFIYKSKSKINNLLKLRKLYNI